MDALRQCLDVLRDLALKTSDETVYLQVEHEIGRYLEGRDASLERLKQAVAEAAASRRNSTFWSTIEEFLSRPGAER